MVALRLEALCKRFGGLHAVHDLSLTVERGQLFGLLGPNGSGKTTTLRCALGLLRPDAGRVEILGRPARDIHLSRGRVAVVFDRPTLVSNLSVAQNLRYGRCLLGHGGGRPDAEALELTGIAALSRQKAGTLSLGQSRRLSIARALIGSPELLVLDEPLSGLDAVGVRAMLSLFLRLREQGITLVLSSHRLHELQRIVTHVAVILAGHVVRAGPLKQLLGTEGERLAVRSPQRDRALQLLEQLPEARCRADAHESDLLFVEGAAAALVGRTLVQGGCDLTALVPERRSLDALFDDLVADHLAPRGRAPHDQHSHDPGAAEVQRS